MNILLASSSYVSLCVCACVCVSALECCCFTGVFWCVCVRVQRCLCAQITPKDNIAADLTHSPPPPTHRTTCSAIMTNHPMQIFLHSSGPCVCFWHEGGGRGGVGCYEFPFFPRIFAPSILLGLKLFREPARSSIF